MKIIFYGAVGEYTDCESIEMEIEQIKTLNDLINKLEERYGAKFKGYLLGDDTCFFLINGKSIMRTGGLNTSLNHDDKIEILPVVEAG